MEGLESTFIFDITMILQVVLIDLALGGDNSIVIGMAAKNLPKHLQKPLFYIITVLCVFFTAVLFKFGLDKVLTQMANGKLTSSLGWHEWVFTIFLPIGAVFLILHTIEFFIDVMTNNAACVQLDAE